ncbi:NAD(P)H-dependent oxidoreductase [Mycobacterium ulcerans]|uniref:flavodoxin family protein n=1 Tax=Mycobacterium ulcerans TaxID=1809 RepID=UPI0012DC5270|nr:NAD(P)H-dependent oxidoreductase [Mycobacterium ulcerans]MEB3967969.1 NAD(P)H-dependent oxidoreductase [Mycobacterium ulcerans]MEB3976146.1 NAD(P)H-dependent oxidoreductase [Mycobacterium ulcerans]MEB4005492.1 NAD(P)H-dependent oxidoreductase [Mycobacterium ulcerans]MEB4415000.1 NAD(P)H-dependent oxidoreductase [Mycobacterium ulcerans]MEB4433287.1 NAD(P)H-dependent oxidoreductase [Mycobacterium ulcerans]
MASSIFHEMKKEGPLYALFLNCTLKKGPEVSNTEALCNLLIDRLKAHEPDIEAEIVRVVDYDVKPGVGNDEGDGDEWPLILEKVKRANIIVPAMPIWMGVRSSVMQRVIERLDGTTRTVMCEKTGQFPLYGSVAGIMVTGNEDGSHDCVANTFGNLLHFGATVPPNTDLYWVGDAGPGASYIEAGGELSPYVRRNAELTATNLLFAAKLLRENPYSVNIAQLNAQMMDRNKVKMAAMKLAIDYMRANMPD